jgi:hypothetical protein
MVDPLVVFDHMILQMVALLSIAQDIQTAKALEQLQQLQPPKLRLPTVRLSLEKTF